MVTAVFCDSGGNVHHLRRFLLSDKLLIKPQMLRHGVGWILCEPLQHFIKKSSRSVPIRCTILTFWCMITVSSLKYGSTTIEFTRQLRFEVEDEKDSGNAESFH